MTPIFTAEFWLCQAFVACWIIGFWNAFEPDMIFGWFAKWCYDHDVPEWITKPTFDCPMCQASLHGSIIWSFVSGFNFFEPMDWLWCFGFILAQSGLQRIIVDNLIKKG